MDKELIAAIASPPGRGAISVIRMSGKNCFEVLDRVFIAKCGKEAALRPARKMMMGKLFRGERLLDEGMCTTFPSPGSYTGEESAELYCHGGRVVTGEVLSALMEVGCRLAKGGEFTQRALLNGRMSLTAAEAVEELIDAANPLYAATAAKNLSGRFGRKIKALRESLLEAAAHYAAALDYADEGVEPPDPQKIENLLITSAEELKRLKEGCIAGKKLREGTPVALVGRTNSGKSTLLNCLLGYDRAIVTQYAGTTRDVLEESVNLPFGSLRLYDTAGFRETDDPVEKIGIEKSRESLKLSSLVLLLFDGSQVPSEEDRIAVEAVEEERKCRQIPVIKVINKQDREKAFDYEKYLPDLPSVHISAKSGEGTEELLRLLEQYAGSRVEEADMVTNLRHADLITRAYRVLEETEADRKAGMTDDVIWSGLTEVLTLLGEITGDEVQEDMINKIFENFCVGK